MIIPRNITFEQLNVLHETTAQEYNSFLDSLRDNLDALNNADWRGNLRSREVMTEIAALSGNIVSDVLDVMELQKKLDRLNNKRVKMLKDKK